VSQPAMESTNDDGLALTRQALAVLDQVDTTCLPPHALASLQAQKLSLWAQMADLQAQRDFIAQTSLLLMGFSAATQTQTQSPERIHDRAQSQAPPPRSADTLPDADEAKEVCEEVRALGDFSTHIYLYTKRLDYNRKTHSSAHMINPAMHLVLLLKPLC